MYYDDIKKELYISLPMEKIVVKLDPSKNPILIDQVAGTGEHCKGNNPCGDNGKAVEAQLTYPKVCTTQLSPIKCSVFGMFKGIAAIRHV